MASLSNRTESSKAVWLLKLLTGLLLLGLTASAAAQQKRHVNLDSTTRPIPLKSFVARLDKITSRCDPCSLLLPPKEILDDVPQEPMAKTDERTPCAQTVWLTGIMRHLISGTIRVTTVTRNEDTSITIIGYVNARKRSASDYRTQAEQEKITTFRKKVDRERRRCWEITPGRSCKSSGGQYYLREYVQEVNAAAKVRKTQRERIELAVMISPTLAKTIDLGKLAQANHLRMTLFPVNFTIASGAAYGAFPPAVDSLIFECFDVADKVTRARK